MHNGKLQVGVVGVGGIAREQHLPAWGKVPFAEVSAVADLSESALDRAAATFAVPQRFRDWQELVRLDLDVVDICTPNRTHTPIVLAALQSGKHVLCEKPLATTADEIRSLRDTSRKCGRLLMTGHHYRFHAVAKQLKTMIDAGTFGEIYYSRAQFLRRRMLPARTTFIERQLSGGGPVLDVGVHILDLAYWFLGAPEPVSVSAFVDAKLAHRADLSGAWGDWDRERFDVEDFAAGFVRFANGTALTLETSWLAFQPERELVRLQCFGTQAGLIWPDGIVIGETNRTPWTTRLEEGVQNSPYQDEIMHFATAIRDGLPSPVPVEETLQVMRILEGFYQSAEAKREIALT